MKTGNRFHSTLPALVCFTAWEAFTSTFSKLNAGHDNIKARFLGSNGVLSVCQDDPSQGDLGTLANVVTSLGHLNKSSEDGNDLMGVETLSNGDSSMTDIQAEEQSASDITR